MFKLNRKAAKLVQGDTVNFLLQHSKTLKFNILIAQLRIIYWLITAKKIHKRIFHLLYRCPLETYLSQRDS